MAGEADEIRELEKQKLEAFVAKDVETLQRLHANDFQLVNPAGQELNREDYLNGVALGYIEYRKWQPEGRIQVYVFGEAAILRYKAMVQLAVQGEAQPEQQFWQLEV